jgi:hypothetical protein
MAGLGPAIVDIFPGAYAQLPRVIAARLFWQPRRYGTIHPFECAPTAHRRIVRSKDRGLALFYVEPVLAQRGNDVWIVRDENSVGARLRRYAELARHSSDDEIIELGLFCAEVDGVGKFVKSLNVLSWEEACELNPKLRAASTSRVAAE